MRAGCGHIASDAPLCCARSLPSTNSIQKPREDLKERTLNIDPKRIDSASFIRRVAQLAFKPEERFLWEFTPLDSRSNNIRLLALMPGTGDENVSCKQVNVSLNDDVSYEALSYV